MPPRHGRCTTPRVGTRRSDIGRHCRRAGSRLLPLVVVFVATCAGEPESAGPVVIPAPAIVEDPIQPPAGLHIAVAPAPSITARVVENGEPVADAEVSISDGS